VPHWVAGHHRARRFQLARNERRRLRARAARYTNQAQFLINCGITDVLARTPAEDAAAYLPLAAGTTTRARRKW